MAKKITSKEKNKQKMGDKALKKSQRAIVRDYKRTLKKKK